MLNGILNLSVWGHIIATLILTHITVVTTTIYLHRGATHRALDLHPVASHFFRFWIWLTTAQVTKEWVAVHRKHHARCETKDDPHSPQVLGIKKVFFEGYELYRKEANNLQTLELFGKGTPDDWIERNVYTPLSVWGVSALFFINIFLFGILGITMWAVQMMCMPFFAAGVVNGIGHYWGYRNFECPDAARNVIPIGILLGGEELHNNHHTYGSSARFSRKWWEFDIGWFYIQILCFLRLAKVRRVAPKPHVVKGKTMIDFDTVMAVLKNRFQIMSDYTRSVIKPILEEERRKAGEAGSTLLRRAQKLIWRDPSLIDSQSIERLESLLEQNKSLQVVYQYQQRLREIWAKTTATKDELREALVEWCRAAEASGLDVLREFAQYLKGFALTEEKV